MSTYVKIQIKDGVKTHGLNKIPTCFNTIFSIMFEIETKLQQLMSAISNDKFISNNNFISKNNNSLLIKHPEALPPTSDALKLHIMRAHYQSLVCKQANCSQQNLRRTVAGNIRTADTFRFWCQFNQFQKVAWNLWAVRANLLSDTALYLSQIQSTLHSIMQK